MTGWCVDFVHSEVLDWVLFVFVGLFLGDDQLPFYLLRDGKLLRPDVVGVGLDVALNRVDVLCPRIGADFFSAVDHFAVALKRADPVVAVGFDVFDKSKVMGKPRVEEAGVPVDIYLFFELGDDLAGKIVLDFVILVDHIGFE